VRGVGSSNLPVPTNSILNFPKKLREGGKELPTHEAPQSFGNCKAVAARIACEGCEAQPSLSAVQICPSRPSSYFLISLPKPGKNRPTKIGQPQLVF
jgi:hypothetical protein